MPLKTPQQWVCSQCGWRQDAVMKSDVLLPKPACCPKCGAEVVMRDAGWVQQLKTVIAPAKRQ